MNTPPELALLTEHGVPAATYERRAAAYRRMGEVLDQVGGRAVLVLLEPQTGEAHVLLHGPDDDNLQAHLDLALEAQQVMALALTLFERREAAYDTAEQLPVRALLDPLEGRTALICFAEEGAGVHVNVPGDLDLAAHTLAAQQALYAIALYANALSERLAPAAQRPPPD